MGTGLGPTLEFYSLVSAELQRADLGLWNSSDSYKQTSASIADVVKSPSNTLLHIDEPLAIAENQEIPTTVSATVPFCGESAGTCLRTNNSGSVNATSTATVTTILTGVTTRSSVASGSSNALSQRNMQRETVGTITTRRSAAAAAAAASAANNCNNNSGSSSGSQLPRMMSQQVMAHELLNFLIEAGTVDNGRQLRQHRQQANGSDRSMPVLNATPPPAIEIGGETTDSGEALSNTNNQSTANTGISYVQTMHGLFPLPLGKSSKLSQLFRLKSKFKFLGKFMAKAVMDSRMVCKMKFEAIIFIDI